MSNQQNISFEFRASNLFTPAGVYAYGGPRASMRQALENAIVVTLAAWTTDPKAFFEKLVNELGVEQFITDTIVGGYLANGYDMTLVVYLDGNVAVHVERLQGYGLSMPGMMNGMMPGMGSMVNVMPVNTHVHTGLSQSPITKGETVPFHFYKVEDYYAPGHPLRDAKMYMVLNCLPGLSDVEKPLLELIEDYTFSTDGQLWPEGVIPLKELASSTVTKDGTLNNINREVLLETIDSQNVIIVIYENMARLITEPLKPSFNSSAFAGGPGF